MADLEKIAESLSSLTILEASELTKILEEKWGVTAAAQVAVAAAPAGGDAGGRKVLKARELRCCRRCSCPFRPHVGHP